jgi:23S rRNA (cytidine1920-2'-O)/16S rRNA (cytidine1409-2'-O)-methyltransferase
MAGKQRLDVLLVEKGLFPTREKAKTSIMAGLIKVDGRIVDKAGTEVPVDVKLDVIRSAHPYVSRGGLKFEKAVKEFGLDLRGMTVVDVGASTGGFTDCMLQNGAAQVYAIDVGYGQLDWKLRNDSRVVNMERTNIRYLDCSEIKEKADLVSVDISFISLEKVLLKISELLKPDGILIALIKPQFEAGREKVGKKGVVRDPDTHKEVIRRVLDTAGTIGFETVGITYSPIKGPEGNIEYLANMMKTGQKAMPASNINIDILVAEAFVI